LQAHYHDVLPEQITGAEFISQYGSHGDPVTVIDPTRFYPVRESTVHPIYENHRVQLYAQLLQAYHDMTTAQLLGELMYQSHQSYSACGLGSSVTDAIVAAVRLHGAPAGLYGAKITGGGSGGTVAVLAESEAVAVVQEIATMYGTGLVIRGSSDGAARCPVTQWESTQR
jgi:L-arabinokinase